MHLKQNFSIAFYLFVKLPFGAVSFLESLLPWVPGYAVLPVDARPMVPVAERDGMEIIHPPAVLVDVVDVRRRPDTLVV